MPSWDTVHESCDSFSPCSSDYSDDFLIDPCSNNLHELYHDQTQDGPPNSSPSIPHSSPRKRCFFSPGVRRFLQIFLILYSATLTVFLGLSSFKTSIFSSIFSRYIVPKLDFSLQSFQLLDLTNDGASICFNVSLNDEFFTAQEASNFEMFADSISISYSKHDQPKILVKFYPQSNIIVQNSSLDSGLIQIQVFENNFLDLIPQNSNNLSTSLISDVNSRFNFFEEISFFDIEVENLTLHYNRSILSHIIPLKLMGWYPNYNSFTKTNLKTFRIDNVKPQMLINKIVSIFKVDLLNISNDSTIQLQDIYNLRILNSYYSIQKKENYKLTTVFDTEITLFNNSNDEMLKLPDFTLNNFKFDMFIPLNFKQNTAIKFSRIIIDKFTLQQSQRKFNLSVICEIPQISHELLSADNESMISTFNKFVLNLLSPLETENYIYLKNSVLSNNPFWISKIFEEITIPLNLNPFFQQVLDEYSKYATQNTSSSVTGLQVLLDSLIFSNFSVIDLEFIEDKDKTFEDILLLKDALISSTWALSNESNSNKNFLNSNFLNDFSCDDIKGNFTISQVDTFANSTEIETEMISFSFDDSNKYSQSLIFKKDLISKDSFVSLNYNLTSYLSGITLKVLDPETLNQLFHQILIDSEMEKNVGQKVVSQLKLKLHLNEFILVNFDLFEMNHTFFKEIYFTLNYNLTTNDLRLLKKKLVTFTSFGIDDKDSSLYNEERKITRVEANDNLFEIDTVEYLSSTKDSIILKANARVFTPTNWLSGTHYLKFSTSHNYSTQVNHCLGINDHQEMKNFPYHSQIYQNENDFLKLEYFTGPNDENIQLGNIVIQSFQFDSTSEYSNISVILNLDPFSYFSQNEESMENHPIILAPAINKQNYPSDVKEIVRKLLSDIISKESPIINISFAEHAFAKNKYLSLSLQNLSFLMHTPTLKFSESEIDEQKSHSWPFYPPQLGTSKTSEKTLSSQKTASSSDNGIILNVIFHLMSSEVQLLIHNPLLNSDIHIIILEAETMYMKPLSSNSDNSDSNDIELLPLAHLATYPIIELNIPANENYLTPRLAVVFEKKALRVLKDALSHGIDSIDIVSKSFFLLKVQYFEIGLNYTGTGLTADITF